MPDKIGVQGFCRENYRGKACSLCIDGYAKFGCNVSNLFENLASGICQKCKDNESYYLKFSFFLLIQAITIILQLKYICYYVTFSRNLIQNSNLDVKDDQAEILLIKKITAASIKIMIDYIQLINLISDLDFLWPEAVNSYKSYNYRYFNI